MKIVCPNCEATYEVPESVLASKRQVRCARCGNDWVPGAAWQPETAPAAFGPDGVPGAAPEPMPEPAPAYAETPNAEPTPHHVADIPPPAAPEHASEDAPPAAPEHAPAEAEPYPEPLAEPDPATLPPAAARLRQSAATAFGDPADTPAATAPATRTPVAAWAASILLLVALAGAGVAFKTQVMKAWPASERLYTAVGLYTQH